MISLQPFKRFEIQGQLIPLLIIVHFKMKDVLPDKNNVYTKHF